MQILEFVPLSLRDSSMLVFEYINSYAAEVLDVYAGILADVRVAAIFPPEGETCDVTLVTCTEAGDQAACCDVTVAQATQVIGENAYAELSAPRRCLVLLRFRQSVLAVLSLRVFCFLVALSSGCLPLRHTPSQGLRCPVTGSRTHAARTPLQMHWRCSPMRPAQVATCS